MRLRYAVARILPNEAVAKCGRRVFSSQVGIALTEGRAHFQGVQTCGSVWMCPCCAGYVAEGRRREVRALADQHGRQFHNGAIYMAAFTMPHHAFQTAETLRWAVTQSWSKLIAGKPWINARARAHCRGWIRALEVTHGQHGWHPHIHAVFFLEDETHASEFGRWLYARWKRAIARMGFGECNQLAWSWQRAAHYDAATDYVVKGNFDSELTRGHTKLGKAGGRSPWQLLADAAESDHRAAALFAEFAAAFKGARQVTYSSGLRDEVAADEELADPPAHEFLGALSSRLYHKVVERRLCAEILDAAECDGWAGVIAVLNREGLSDYTALLRNSLSTPAAGAT